MFEKREITEDLLDKTFKASRLKDGRWFARIPIAYDPETKKYKHKAIYGENEREVLKNTRRYIRDESERLKLKKETDELFTTLFEKWLYEYKFIKVKGTTFDRYEETYLYQIKPVLEPSLKLKDATGDDLQKVITFAMNKGYSYSTILKTYRLLKDFFAYHIKHEYISKDPMAKVEMFKRDAVVRKQEQLRALKDEADEKKQKYMPLTKEETELLDSKLRMSDRGEIRYFSDEEIAKIKDVIANGFYVDRLSRSKKLVTYGPFYLQQGEVFLFMLNTGLRAGEMLALKYSDVDWDNMTIAITKNVVSVKNRGLDGKKTEGRTTKQSSVKTENSYHETLEVNSAAIKFLQELKSKEPEGYNDYILHNGDKPISPRAFEKRFYNLLDAAKIERTGLHTLRHTFASKLYAQTNGDTKLVSEMLRHASVSFTAQTYIHIERKYKQKRLKDFEI